MLKDGYVEEEKEVADKGERERDRDSGVYYDPTRDRHPLSAEQSFPHQINHDMLQMIFTGEGWDARPEVYNKCYVCCGGKKDRAGKEGEDKTKREGVTKKVEKMKTLNNRSKNRGEQQSKDKETPDGEVFMDRFSGIDDFFECCQ